MQSLGSGCKNFTLKVQLRFYEHRSYYESLFFKNLLSSSNTSNFSDVKIATEWFENTSKNYNKEQTTVLKSVYYCSFPIYLNQFEEETPKTKDYHEDDQINREERLMLENPLFSIVIANILVNFDEVAITNFIPVKELDSIFVVDIPKYMKFNPHTGQIPASLISYLRNMKCIPPNTCRTKHSKTLLTKSLKEETLEHNQVNYGRGSVFTTGAEMCKPEFKKTEILQTVVEEDPIIENLKRRLFEIIRKKKQSIEISEFPKSLKHFSLLQLIKRGERWFLKVNALNLYLKLIMPGALILDMSQPALVKRFISIFEAQIKSSLFYSSYFHTTWPQRTQPQSFCTKENYEKFLKDRLECFSTLQKEYPGEQYYLVELAKCFEFQDNVCLLTGPLSVLKNRLNFIEFLEEIPKKDIVELNDLCYREHSKLKGILDREICKFKVEKYLIDNDEMQEEEIINIVKEHYNNLAVIVNERSKDPSISMFRYGFTHKYFWLYENLNNLI